RRERNGSDRPFRHETVPQSSQRYRCVDGPRSSSQRSQSDDSSESQNQAPQPRETDQRCSRATSRGTAFFRRGAFGEPSHRHFRLFGGVLTKRASRSSRKIVARFRSETQAASLPSELLDLLEVVRRNASAREDIRVSTP